jgi:hypothetical protein
LFVRGTISATATFYPLFWVCFLLLDGVTADSFHWGVNSDPIADIFLEMLPAGQWIASKGVCSPSDTLKIFSPKVCSLNNGDIFDLHQFFG